MPVYQYPQFEPWSSVMIEQLLDVASVQVLKAESIPLIVSRNDRDQNLQQTRKTAG